MYFIRRVRIRNRRHEKYDQLVQLSPIPKQDIIRFHNNMIFSVYPIYTAPKVIANFNIEHNITREREIERENWDTGKPRNKYR